jgi:hypothetical protein
MGKACEATEHGRTSFDHFDGYVICIDGIDVCFGIVIV